MRHLLAAGVAAAVLASGAQAADWRPVEQHVARGGVDATLTYDRRLDRFGLSVYRNVRLVVRHGPETVFDGPVCRGGRCQPYDGALRGGYDLALADVWGDQRPEAIVSIYTGYAHCCFQTAVALAAPGRRGRIAFRDWGNAPDRLDRHGGETYLVAGDDRFAYAFTSFAASWFPVQAWRLDETGAFVDVTKERPDLLRADAARAWKTYLDQRQDGDVRGVLAGWCADQYLLERREACTGALEDALRDGYLGACSTCGGDTWATGQAFVALVRSKLAAWGYE